MLYQDGDYFIKRTDDDWLCVGRQSADHFSVPPTHGQYARILKARSRAEVESLHNEFIEMTGRYAMNFESATGVKLIRDEDYENIEAVRAAYPGAAKIVEVDRGWAVFGTMADYEMWADQL